MPAAATRVNIRGELEAILSQLECVRETLERVLVDLDYTDMDGTWWDVNEAKNKIEEIMGRIGAVIRELEG